MHNAAVSAPRSIAAIGVADDAEVPEISCPSKIEILPPYVCPGELD
jgi:hypothetical protein